MSDKDALVRGYAEALYRVAEAEGELESVEEQLYAFAKFVDREPRVREALTDPGLPVENKKGLIADALGERANPIAVHLLGFLVEQGRARELGRIVDELAEISAEHRERAVAEVRSAVPLDEQRHTRLAEALSAAIGHPVEVKVIVDPSLVGGLVAKVGDEIFDGSVRSRLAEAREHLVG
ncbi:MAG: ATP synthase F1 subunit delta [Actinobacteria bacterium]|nr:ATP synthase F1 subunit delta [Actinomycetota bacterium]